MTLGSPQLINNGGREEEPLWLQCQPTSFDSKVHFAFVGSVPAEPPMLFLYHALAALHAAAAVSHTRIKDSARPPSTNVLQSDGAADTKESKQFCLVVEENKLQ